MILIRYMLRDRKSGMYLTYSSHIAPDEMLTGNDPVSSLPRIMTKAELERSRGWINSLENVEEVYVTIQLPNPPGTDDTVF